MNAKYCAMLACLSVFTSTGSFLPAVANAQTVAEPVYEVTITNVTKAQSFTPILVVSHQPAVSIFTLGQPASSGLATLAEEGDNAPLRAALDENPSVVDTQSSQGLLAPGQSVTIQVSARRARRISVAGMLIPTNDAFFALNCVSVPTRRGQSSVFFARAYDSGTEVNDELCASIPGPSFEECGGAGGGGAPAGGEEGFVHIHNGIHEIGDLKASTRDWRGEVARIEITRTR